MPTPLEDHPPAVTPSRRFQFSLRTLLLFCLVIAIFIGGICAHNKPIQFWTFKLWFILFPAALLALAIYGRASIRAFSIGASASFLWITLIFALTGDERLREFFSSYNPDSINPYNAFQMLPPPPINSTPVPLSQNPTFGETSQAQETLPPNWVSPSINSPTVPILYLGNPTFLLWDYLYPILYSLIITSISCFAGFLTVFLRSYAISSQQRNSH